MDYMYNACSTTARRGALDWAPIFEKANLPVFEKLYESVKNGTETRKSLEFNGRKTYREDLAKELKEIDEQEIWRAGMCALFFVIWRSESLNPATFRQDCSLAASRLQAVEIHILPTPKRRPAPPERRHLEYLEYRRSSPFH